MLHIKPNKPWSTANIITSICAKNRFGEPKKDVQLNPAGCVYILINITIKEGENICLSIWTEQVFWTWHTSPLKHVKRICDVQETDFGSTEKAGTKNGILRTGNCTACMNAKILDSCALLSCLKPSIQLQNISSQNNTDYQYWLLKQEFGSHTILHWSKMLQLGQYFHKHIIFKEKTKYFVLYICTSQNRMNTLRHQPLPISLYSTQSLRGNCSKWIFSYKEEKYFEHSAWTDIVKHI